MEDNLDNIINQTANSGGPTLRMLMDSLRDLEARMDNAEANSLGTREILYRIPGDEKYTKLATALDQMYDSIDDIKAKVDEIIEKNADKG